MRKPLTALLALSVALLAAHLIHNAMGHDTPPASPPPASQAPTARTTPSPADLPPAIRIEDHEPGGSLRLEGQVIDAEEHPVGGAIVALATVPGRLVRTEQDGSFVFDRLLPRTYTVWARQGALAAAPVEARLSATSDPVILILKPTPGIEALVLAAATHVPLAGARVEVIGPGGLGASTDPAGKARLEGLSTGRYLLRATAPGFASATQPVLHLGTGRGLTPVVFLLSPGVEVPGRVIDNTGAPVAGARVRALQASASLPSEAQQGEDAVTDAQGQWKLAALPAGSYRFLAVHPPQAPGLSDLVVLGDSPPALVTIRLQDGARLDGRVVNKQGAPVASATIEVHMSGATLERRALADERGAFTLAGLPRTRLQVQAHSDEASSPAERVDLGSGQASVTLTLDADAVISGIVVRPEGTPVPGVQVVATPDDRSSVLEMLDSRLGRYASDVSDGGGAFHLRGLKPGAYRVRASQAHSVQAPNFWLSPGVLARTGATDVRVILPREGSLRGRVELAGGRIPARFSVALTLLPPTEFQAPRGDFRLDEVPPGHHTVTITAPGARPKTLEGIELAPGQEKDLGRVLLDPGRVITGQVVDASGQPVAGASVLAGPQVLGDGQRLGGAELRTLSDRTGHFTLDGAGDGPLQVMAEHPTRGRSRLQSIADSASTSLQLSLEPFAALEGQVTSQGAPVAQAPMVAAPRGSPSTRFFVSTQSDGRYRFDRLAPGEYLVTTVLRPDPTTQILESVPAVVGDASPARADIDVQLGTYRLGVQLLEADGRPIGNAQVYLSTGSIAAPTLGGLEAALAERGPGRTQIGLLLQGRPLVFSQLLPGPYTLCAIPVRGNLDDPTVVQQVRDRAALLPSLCAAVSVAPGLTEQQAVLRLPAPPPS